MTRHFNNAKSVQAQLDEMKQLKEKLEVLTSELKEYMEENDIDSLNGLTNRYVRTYVQASLTFDTKRFEKENPNLYAQYKTKEKADGYRFEVKAIK